MSRREDNFPKTLQESAANIEYRPEGGSCAGQKMINKRKSFLNLIIKITMLLKGYLHKSCEDCEPLSDVNSFSSNPIYLISVSVRRNVMIKLFLPPSVMTCPAYLSVIIENKCSVLFWFARS